MIIEEEKSKVDRLRQLSISIGLPIYRSRIFSLPSDCDDYVQACYEITNSGEWNIALRFMVAPDYRSVFRQLGADLESALAAMDKFKNTEGCIVRVSPYRIPEKCGTLWIQRGRVTLEVAAGPHTWISRTPPEHGILQSCSFTFPFISLKHSTTDSSKRLKIYRMLREVIGIVCGCKLSMLPDIQVSVYAEFHWHQSVGYCFIECSFSEAWTA